MNAKIFEVRDRATFIPVMAIRLAPETQSEWFLLRRAGFGTAQMDTDSVEPYVIFCRLSDEEMHYDPYAWPNRTMRTAHLHVVEKWDHLITGEVIDVEFILGESTTPKVSERGQVPQ